MYCSTYAIHALRLGGKNCSRPVSAADIDTALPRITLGARRNSLCCYWSTLSFPTHTKCRASHDALPLFHSLTDITSWVNLRGKNRLAFVHLLFSANSSGRDAVHYLNSFNCFKFKTEAFVSKTAHVKISILSRWYHCDL